MQAIFETCGIIASFIATFIEGEILYLTSIISAKMGYFNLYLGMIAAFVGAYTKDMIKFAIVKKKGRSLIEKKPKLKSKLDSASVWFDKRPYFYITFYRLMYGFGTAILMLAGLKDISFKRFAIHSAISVALWIIIIGGLGYFCADVMLEKFEFVSDHKLLVVGILSALGLTYWLAVKRPREKYCYVPKE